MVTAFCSYCNKVSPIKAMVSSHSIPAICSICGSDKKAFWGYKDINDLLFENERLIAALKLAYRKHVLNDDSIGWSELGERLYDEIANAIGDKEFVLWLNTQSTR